MPEISRRGLLKLLGSTALVLPASTIAFFDMGPSVALGFERGYNSFLSIDWIASEALKVLNKNLTFARHVNRDYDSWLDMEGQSFKKGDIISIRGRFQVNPGLSIANGIDARGIELAYEQLKRRTR